MLVKKEKTTIGTKYRKMSFSEKFDYAFIHYPDLIGVICIVMIALIYAIPALVGGSN